MTTGFARSAAALLALAVGATTTAAQSTMTKEQLERRYNVRLFGTILVGAAQQGAAMMGLRVQQIDPSIILLSGTTPRAQGFVIDGHGVFFYVEIPDVDPVVAWAVTTRGRDQAAIEAINGLRAHMLRVSDPQMKQDMEQQIRSLERRLSPPGPARTVPTPGTAPAAAAAPPPVMIDPNMEYERLVTEQLINAMLDHSHQLGLAADEYLTIAARGSQGPLVAQAVFDDTVTLTLRIKGSDLADFRAGKLTRDEAKARIVVREF